LRTIPIPTISHNSPLCQNATLNLSVDPLGSHTYEWRSPAGANLGNTSNISIPNVTTAAAGKYRLIAAYRGCTTYKDTPIDIIVPGMLPTFTSNSPVCVGQTLRLTASGGGGLSYVFSGPNGFSQTTSQPELTVPNVTAVQAGQYGLQVFTGACNSGISTLNVTVSDFIPSASFTINSPVCLGNNITLTIPSYQSGIIYRLTDPRGVTENISIHPHVINNATSVNAGAYRLIAIASGCTSEQVIQTVAVNNLPPPIVPVSQTVCVGNTLSLSVANPAVGATYTWAAPGGHPTYTGATWNRANASAAMNGTYTVTASIAGCPNQIATTAVTASSWQGLGVHTNAPLCSAGALRLTASISLPGATYQWNASNGQSYTTLSPTLEIPSAGPQHAAVYSLTASIPGCTSATITTPYLVIQNIPTPVLQLQTSAGQTTAGACTGKSYKLAITNSGGFPNGYVYQWVRNGNVVANTTIPEYQFVGSAGFSGAYSVSIISGGCTSAVSNLVNVTVSDQPLRPTASNTGPACVGQSITLQGSSAQGGLTFYWQGPNNFTASGPSTMINANPLMAGVYSLVVFNAGGCTSEVATTVVQVNTAGQTPPTLTSNAPICQGQTLRLTATGLPSGVVYTVTGPNGYLVSGVGPEFTRPATALADGGVYTFQYNVGCGNQSATINVTISPKPFNITASSNSPLCVNNTLNLTASNSTPGAGYFWTGPDNFSYMAQSVWRGGMTAQRAGVYSVVAALGNCSSDVATTVVEVYSLPQPLTLTSNAPICTGGTLFLTTNGPAAATYTFSGPGFSQTTASNFTSRPFMPSNGAGTYSVNVTLGSCTGAATTQVSLLPGPELSGLTSNSPVCLGKNLTLNATASGGGTISYRWQGPNNYNVVTGSNVHNIAMQSTAQAGTYSVSAIMGTCTTSARTVDVSVLQYTITASNDGPKCLGETFVFSSTSIPGATYYWNTPDGVTVSSASPNYARPITASNQAGGYTVYAVIGSCTSNTASTVAVLQTLNLNPQITGSRFICEGGMLTFTASNVPTSGYTYFWVTPGGVIAPEGLTFTKMNATIADAGVYKLLARQGACQAVIAQTDVIVTPPSAAPIAGNDGPVCAGGMIKLAASDIRGASYYWRGPNGFTSNQQNPVLNPAANGSYSVAAIVRNCTSVFATTEVQTVAAPATPSISGNSPVCEGRNLILNAGLVPSGVGYYWTGPNGFTSTLQSPIIFNAQLSHAGPYQVVATLGNCSSASALVSISVIRVPNPVLASNNGPACAGQKVTLSVPFLSCVGYYWTGPNGFSSADREPEITNPTPGFYSVTYIAQGCASSTPAVTEVKLITPTPIAAGNNGPVCLGATLQLTATPIAGASYLWQGPNGYTSNQQNPIISSFDNPGTYSATVKVGSCDFGTATTTAAHFPAVPASSASSNQPCVGGTLYLTAATVSGATYYWTGPNGFSRNIQNVEITNVSASQSGTYTLVAIIGNCTSAFSTTQVNVMSLNPPAWASNNGPQCGGQPVTLFAPTAPSGYGYYWTGPNGFSATSQSPTVNSTGEYTLVYTTSGCTSQAAKTQVTIINAQTIVASNGGAYCSGQVIQLNATLVSGATYKWTGPNNFSSSLASPTIPNASGIHQGTYTVEVRISGCTQIATTNVTVISTAISNVTAQSNSPVCVGGAIQLTATATGSGLSYYWRGPNNYESQLQNPVIGNAQTLNAGVYSVSVIANGCTSSPALVNVRVTEITGALTAQNSGLAFAFKL
jgi:hypothetical protein